MIIRTLKLARRVVIAVMGLTLLVVGVALSIPGIPGPGLLVVVGGLALLSAEFIWARKLLGRFNHHAGRLRTWIFRTKGTKFNSGAAKIIQADEITERKGAEDAAKENSD